MAYSLQIKNEKKIAKASVKDLDISWKHAVVVMDFIRGKNLKKAMEMLEQVINKELPVPFKKFNTGVGHRPGGIIGKFPVKASKEILKLLKNVENNAENKGLDGDKLMIIHAKADKGATLERRAPKGRWRHNNITLTHLEVAVREV